MSLLPAVVPVTSDVFSDVVMEPQGKKTVKVVAAALRFDFARCLADPIDDVMEAQLDQAAGRKTAMAVDDSIGSFSRSQNGKSNGNVHGEGAQDEHDQVAVYHNTEKETNQRSMKNKRQAKYKTCPCAAKKEDEVMVQCEDCATWYHMPCAG